MHTEEHQNVLRIKKQFETCYFLSEEQLDELSGLLNTILQPYETVDEGAELLTYFQNNG